MGRSAGRGWLGEGLRVLLPSRLSAVTLHKSGHKNRGHLPAEPGRRPTALSGEHVRASVFPPAGLKLPTWLGRTELSAMKASEAFCSRQHLASLPPLGAPSPTLPGRGQREADLPEGPAARWWGSLVSCWALPSNSASCSPPPPSSFRCDQPLPHSSAGLRGRPPRRPWGLCVPGPRHRSLALCLPTSLQCPAQASSPSQLTPRAQTSCLHPPQEEAPSLAPSRKLPSLVDSQSPVDPAP